MNSSPKRGWFTRVHLPNDKRNDTNIEVSRKRPWQQNTVGKRRMNMFYATFNLLNDILTSSIVSVPYFVIQCGPTSGLLLLFVLAVLGHVTLILLHQLTLQKGYTNMCDMCLDAFGPFGYIGAGLGIFLFNFGGYIAGLIMLADFVQNLLYHSGYEYDRSLVLFVAIVLFIPLAFKKDLSSLNFVTVFSVSVNLCLVFTIIAHSIYSFSGDKKTYFEERESESGSGLLSGIGGLAFFYACHDLAYDVSLSLERPTLTRYAVVSGLAIYIPFILSAILSLCVWAVHGANTKANIVENFPQNHAIAIVLRVLLSLNVIFNIPYTIYMPRAGLIAMIKFLSDQSQPVSSSYGAFLLLLYENAHNINTLFLLISGYYISNTVSDLGNVFGMAGGVSGIAISTVIPCICWLQLGHQILYDRIVRFLLGVAASLGILVALLTSIDCLF